MIDAGFQLSYKAQQLRCDKRDGIGLTSDQQGQVRQMWWSQSQYQSQSFASHNAALNQNLGLASFQRMECVPLRKDEQGPLMTCIRSMGTKLAVEAGVIITRTYLPRHLDFESCTATSRQLKNKKQHVFLDYLLLNYYQDESFLSWVIVMSLS